MAVNASDRRRFLVRTLAAAVALPLLPALAQRAWAQALQPLSPDLPQAKALKYTPDAAKATDPAHKPGSHCANCQFFAAATGACELFSGYTVKPQGWCAAWAKAA
jgi:hypothetical protein